MNKFPDYHRYDAIALAELVKKGEITPPELCEEAISRAEKVNPVINAINYPLFDYARDIASKELPSGPFTGVPFLIKDLGHLLAGFPSSGGSRSMKDMISPLDSEMVLRFKKSGVVIFGKTNTPEFGLKTVTEPELFGPTLNPWDLSRNSGGSSGGAAAAVAAGIVPMAAGSDGGGSIRVPASCCGLFGLKPSRARNPVGPLFSLTWSGAAVDHVLTRSVRDSAAMLDATCGPDIGASYMLPAPEKSYLSSLSEDPGKLKIAFSTENPLRGTVHTECVEAVKKTAALLQSMGHTVEEASPALPYLDMVKNYYIVVASQTAALIRFLSTLTGKKQKRKSFENLTWFMHLMGNAFTASELAGALDDWNTPARIMGEFHQKYDLYLTPTMAGLPVRNDDLGFNLFDSIGIDIVCALGLGWITKISGFYIASVRNWFRGYPYTFIANMTGQPSMSVPLHWTPEDIPIGVQFTAPLAGESLLFRLAARLEEAAPWFNRRPELQYEK
jgi:amidase